MNKKVIAIAVVLLAAGVWAPLALALDPLGPPAAGLRQGGVGLGLDYSFSQMNFKFTDDYKARDNQVTKTFVNLGYGVADNWEVFGRIGGSKWEINDWDELGSTRPAWGLGTKVTIAQDGNLKWGALFQISWNKSIALWNEGDNFEKMTWYEYQIAVGPTYKLTDKVSIYGGPFYNYLRGNDTWTEEGEEGTSVESEHFKGGNHVGGYIGAQVAVNDNLSLNAEYQLVAGASGMGLMLVWKF
jgi:opacity protein-like surface antigen